MAAYVTTFKQINVIFLSLIFTGLLITPSSGNGKLFIGLLEYTGHDNRDVIGSCCDGTEIDGVCMEPCDLVFQISPSKMSGLTITNQRLSSLPIQSSASVEFLLPYVSEQTVNPVIFQFDRWHDHTKFLIQAFDLDEGDTFKENSNTLQLVDEWSVTLNLSHPSDMYQCVNVKSHRRANSLLQLAVRFVCDPTYGGPDCVTDCLLSPWQQECLHAQTLEQRVDDVTSQTFHYFGNPMARCPFNPYRNSTSPVPTSEPTPGDTTPPTEVTNPTSLSSSMFPTTITEKPTDGFTGTTSSLEATAVTSNIFHTTKMSSSQSTTVSLQITSTPSSFSTSVLKLTPTSSLVDDSMHSVEQKIPTSTQTTPTATLPSTEPSEYVSHSTIRASFTSTSPYSTVGMETQSVSGSPTPTPKSNQELLTTSEFGTGQHSTTVPITASSSVYQSLTFTPALSKPADFPSLTTRVETTLVITEMASKDSNPTTEPSTTTSMQSTATLIQSTATSTHSGRVSETQDLLSSFTVNEDFITSTPNILVSLTTDTITKTLATDPMNPSLSETNPPFVGPTKTTVTTARTDSVEPSESPLVEPSPDSSTSTTKGAGAPITTILPETDDDDDDPMQYWAIIVGCVLGGLAVIAVLGYIIYRSRQTSIQKRQEIYTVTPQMISTIEENGTSGRSDVPMTTALL